MVLITRSLSDVQLQVIVDVKWSIKCWGLVRQLTIIDHVCKIVPGHSTLTTSHLFCMGCLLVFQAFKKIQRIIA